MCVQLKHNGDVLSKTN